MTILYRYREKEIDLLESDDDVPKDRLYTTKTHNKAMQHSTFRIVP